MVALFQKVLRLLFLRTQFIEIQSTSKIQNNSILADLRKSMVNCHIVSYRLVLDQETA
jgi:hypothetical protein